MAFSPAHNDVPGEVEIGGGLRGDVGEDLGVSAELDAGGVATFLEITDVYRPGVAQGTRPVGCGAC